MSALAPITSANHPSFSALRPRFPESQALNVPSVFDTCAFDLQFGEKPGATFRPIGSILGGSIGVRGLFLDVSTRPWSAGRGVNPKIFRICEADFTEFANIGIDILRERGVGRIHVFSDARIPEVSEFWKKMGFSPCQGEKLWTRRIVGDEPGWQRGLENPLSISRATVADIRHLQGRVAGVKELAFEPWEFNLIEKQINHPDRYFFVVRDRNTPIGLSIGGRLHGVATFTHTWIDEEYRRHKIGERFAGAILRAIYADGVRQVYLMTTDGNDGADRFWGKMNFAVEPEIGFLELDV